MTSAHPRSVKVTDVNPHLLCVLCGGYYVDATTIIECLHSFCKSCIVKYLETNKYCPICDVQVHKTKPLLNIRSDRTLQAIVYKLVPGLFQRELNCRKEFYRKFPESKPCNSEDAGELADDSPIFLPDEPILLGVQYSGSLIDENRNKRYLRCPAAITIHHLQKLMRTKFSLNTNHKVEFFHDGDSLPDYLSLIDLAYMYHWKRKHPVELEYRLLECQQKKIKLFHEENKLISEKNKQNILECEKNITVTENPIEQPDREVQLQISENGIISVHSVDFNTNSLNNTVVSSKSDDKVPISDNNSAPMNDIQPETIELMKSLEETVALDFESSYSKTKDNNGPSFINPEKSSDNKAQVHTFPLSSKNEQTCSENKNESHDNDSPLVPTIHPVTTSSMPISSQKVYPGAVKEVMNTSKPQNMKQTRTEIKGHETQKLSTERSDCVKPLSNIRYKTLKSPIKPWNPTIPRSALIAMKQAQLSNQEKGEPSAKSSSKAPKFFKMRNVPRFLGNPASGVKPMYQVLPGTELSTHVPQTSSSQSSKQNNEVTVMKIDPKTLSPITTSHSTRSPKFTSSPNKLSPSFVYSSQKPSQTQMNSKTSIRNPVSKSGTASLKTSSQIPNTSLTSNPFMLPTSHPPHMMYSGFPRSFTSVDSSGSRLPSDNQIFRAMSMLCSPGAAFHPSLPPSISMLFNPHHPHHRSSQNEKLNLKYAANEFYKSVPSTTPSVQRVPPSGPSSKIPSSALNNSIVTTDTKMAMPINQDHQIPSKIEKVNANEKNICKDNKDGSLPSTTKEFKNNSSTTSLSKISQDHLRNRQEDTVFTPLSNGFSMVLSSNCSDETLSRLTPSKGKDDLNKIVPLKKDTLEVSVNRVDKHVNKVESYHSSVN